MATATPTVLVQSSRLAPVRPMCAGCRVFLLLRCFFGTSMCLRHQQQPSRTPIPWRSDTLSFAKPVAFHHFLCASVSKRTYIHVDCNTPFVICRLTLFLRNGGGFSSPPSPTRHTILFVWNSRFTARCSLTNMTVL